MEKATRNNWFGCDAEEYLDAYIAAAGIDDPKAPLIQSAGQGAKAFRAGPSTGATMLDVVKLRCRAGK